jgi:hypothetical protein
LAIPLPRGAKPFGTAGVWSVCKCSLIEQEELSSVVLFDLIHILWKTKYGIEDFSLALA